jgi:protein NrfC
MAENKTPKAVSRREFLKDAALLGGSVVGGGVLTGFAPAPFKPELIVSAVPFDGPASQGYLVVDSTKCAGCLSCMHACALAHEGKENITLARIQVVSDTFEKFPADITINQCHQCATPICVMNCPTGACHIDTANGNVRVIDEAKCIGCGTCLTACPYTPHRTVWNAEKKKAAKCDLCINAPYWSQKGGPTGQQACVAACAMKAISLVKSAPKQYEMDLKPAPTPTPAPTTAPAT